jgi:hypothetical protein
MSVIYSVITQLGPSAIQNMIAPVPGKINEFLVQFPGYAHNPISVHLTPAQVAMYSYNTDGGVYLAVLGAAAEGIMRKEDPEANLNRLPFGNIINGGPSHDTIKLLTGETNHSISIPSDKSLTSGTMNTIKSALDNHEPVIIETADHDMSITEIAEQAPTKPVGINCYPPGAKGPFVIIHNQWGDTGSYYPIKGSNVSVNMVHGYFAVDVASLSEYGMIYVMVPDKGQKPIVFDKGPSIAATANIGGRPLIGNGANGSPQSIGGGGGEGSSYVVKNSWGTGWKSSGYAVLPPEINSGLMYSGAGSGPMINHIEMHPGTMLVAHSKPVTVHIPGGKVEIASNAAVYIVQNEKTTAIMSLTDSHDGAVSFGKLETTGWNVKPIPIRAGQALIIGAADQQSLDSLGASIPAGGSKQVNVAGLDSVYVAPFSPVEALKNSRQFALLLKDTSKEKKAIADHILKTAAVMQALGD